MQKEEKESLSQGTIKDNKVLVKCLKVLMHRLLHQYRSESYEVNSFLNEYYQELNKEFESLKANEISETEEAERSSCKSHLEYIEVFEIWPEICVFIWELASIPKIYVIMLRAEEIYAESSECIDMHVFTTKIYKNFILKASTLTKYTKLFEELIADQIYYFLEEVSLQICSYFRQSQEIIINELEYTTSIVQSSKIINFYLLFKIFKDLSLTCKHRITELLELGLFRNIPMEVIESFTLYIVEKYELIHMNMIDGREDTQDPQTGEITEKVSIADKIANSNNVRWREAVREDGQIGVLLELGDEGDRQSNYMLVLDENDDENIKIIHSSSLTKEWKVHRTAQKNTSILPLIKSKKSLVEKMRNSSTTPIKMTLIENVGVIGGSMGKCLAEIDKYENIGDFMISLSKRTLIGGSFNYLLMQVPLLGYVFVTGGFTYTFYYIFTNQYANGNKKMRELRNITINTATGAGSGLIGATIGQTLIPVPMLGAFIGGLIGGFIGELGGRVISKSLESSRFKKTILCLKETIQPKGYWEVNKQTLKILEVNKEKFYETIPESLENKMNCDRIWLTLIFFTMICFDESKQRVKVMEKALKKQKEIENNSEEYDIVLENEKMENNTEYEPSVDFQCILGFFEEQCIIFIHFHDQISVLLEKVFARLQ